MIVIVMIGGVILPDHRRILPQRHKAFDEEPKSDETESIKTSLTLTYMYDVIVYIINDSYNHPDESLFY